MSPTAELRFVDRVVYTWESMDEVRVLQQKWVQHHIPAGMTEAPFQWRDVPTAQEQS